YRGRWEPIVRSFEGFRDGPDFNLVEYPLSMRLKMTPGYLARRKQLRYGLLAGEASFPSLERRGTMRLLKPGAEPPWRCAPTSSRTDVESSSCARRWRKTRCSCVGGRASSQSRQGLAGKPPNTVPRQPFDTTRCWSFSSTVSPARA